MRPSLAPRQTGPRPGAGRPAWVLLCAFVFAASFLAPAAADPPGYAWEEVAVVPPPSSMHPGQKVTVVVVLRNTGPEAWTSGPPTPMSLGATTPRDRTSPFARRDPTWSHGGSRVPMLTPSVPRGGVGVFAFTFTAPVPTAYPAHHEERFAPVVDGVGWLDSQDLEFDVTVRPLSGALPPLPDPDPTPPPTPEPVPTPSPLPNNACTGEDDVPSDATDLFPPAVALGYGPAPAVGRDVLDGPAAVAIDPLGKLLVADTAADRVLRLDPETGRVLSSWSGDALQDPSGIAASPTARLYVTDTGNDRVVVGSLSGVQIGVIGGSGTEPGRFSSPTGIAVVPSGDSAGAIVVADTGNARVQILSATGDPVTVIGGPDALSAPSAVSVYRDRVYVADTGNDVVRRFTLDGEPDGVYGGPGEGTGCMVAPVGVVADAFGVFVSDAGGRRIHRFHRGGLLLDTWGTTDPPAGLASRAGDLWAAAPETGVVRRFRPALQLAPPVPCAEDPAGCP